MKRIAVLVIIGLLLFSAAAFAEGPAGGAPALPAGYRGEPAAFGKTGTDYVGLAGYAVLSPD